MNHVAARRHVCRIREPAPARNHPGAALRAVLGDGQVEDPVQPVEHALDAAAFVDLDHRVADRRIQVAGADDFRMPEEHDAVAVGRGGRRVYTMTASPLTYSGSLWNSSK